MQFSLNINFWYYQCYNISNSLWTSFSFLVVQSIVFSSYKNCLYFWKGYLDSLHQNSIKAFRRIFGFWAKTFVNILAEHYKFLVEMIHRHLFIEIDISLHVLELAANQCDPNWWANSHTIPSERELNYYHAAKVDNWPWTTAYSILYLNFV